MKTLSASIHRILSFQWSPHAEQEPPRSGIYLTRNERAQEWFRYFDARLGEWYVSWAEMQTRACRDTARIKDADLAAEVVAWAHCTRLTNA